MKSCGGLQLARGFEGVGWYVIFDTRVGIMKGWIQRYYLKSSWRCCYKTAGEVDRSRLSYG